MPYSTDRLARRLLFCLATTRALAGCGTSEPANEPTAECAPGREDCACLDGDVCEAGLLCRDGQCRGTEAHDVHVTNAAARACELLVEESGTQVLDVRFAAGSQGSHVREAPRTAIAFMRSEDARFEGAPTTLLTTRGGALRPVSATCFDAAGALVPGVHVEFD